MERQLEILITNDDSYISKGFNTLIALCATLGNVTAVAPKYAQSGMSAALSMGKPLFLNKEDERTTASGNKITIYSFTGTPADCVKIAMNKFFSREHKPDLMFSGIVCLYSGRAHRLDRFYTDNPGLRNAFPDRCRHES